MTTEQRVLIVDDLNGTREILREMLNELGFNEIVEACNGKEALQLLGQGSVTLIISDYEMGELSGMELLRQVKSDPAHSKIPFVMVSSQYEPAIMHQAIKEGADVYIAKPLRLNTLQQKITSLLREEEDPDS